jgi:tol-pal system protein YbgF
MQGARGKPAMIVKPGNTHSRGPRWRAAGLVLLLCLAALPAAQAGLFDDEEARKAIVELRARVAQGEEAQRLRISELAAANGQIAAANSQLAAANAQLVEQLATLRRSLLDLNNQIESLRSEMAKLRGNEEQMMRELADLQRRQRDVGQSLDDRLRRVEPVKVSLDGREFMVDPEEKRAYDEAIAAIRKGEFDKSVVMLSNFQRRYGAGPYGDAARFWLGNAQYGKRDYKEAMASFRAFVTAAPDHPRAAEALLALANSQAETKDTRAARKTLEDLIKAYPQSEAAQAARERLPSLK